jgi:hypothetical protein
MGAGVDHAPGLTSHLISEGLTAKEVDLYGTGLWNVSELA